MKRTELLQEIRMMRFKEAYEGWDQRLLTQEEAARIVGVSERTFRRYIERDEEAGLEALIDKRLEQVLHRRAPVEEVMAVQERYRSGHVGWNVRHLLQLVQAGWRHTQLYLGEKSTPKRWASREDARVAVTVLKVPKKTV